MKLNNLNLLTPSNNAHHLLSSTLSSILPTTIADTGATGHYMALEDSKYLTNLNPVEHGILVELPNGSFIKSSHTALLDLPSIPAEARVAHVFPDLKSPSLLSIGALCDHGLTAIYDKHKVFIYDGNKKSPYWCPLPTYTSMGP